MKPANIASLARALCLVGAAMSTACGGGGGQSSTASGGTGGTAAATGGTGGTGGAAGGQTTTISTGGQSTGGGGSSTTTSVGVPFPCGDVECDSATQYCLESGGGPCCSPNGYECKPLPSECQSPGAGCPCFDQAPCPCGDESLCQDPSIGKDCSAVDGGLMFSCMYP